MDIKAGIGNWLPSRPQPAENKDLVTLQEDIYKAWSQVILPLLCLLELLSRAVKSAKNIGEKKRKNLAGDQGSQKGKRKVQILIRSPQGVFLPTPGPGARKR